MLQEGYSLKFKFEFREMSSSHQETDVLENRRAPVSLFVKPVDFILHFPPI